MTRLLSVSRRGSFSLDLFAPFLYTISDKKGGAIMPYVALIGLYFAPILCLLGAGWIFFPLPIMRTDIVSLLMSCGVRLSNSLLLSPAE